MRLPDFLVIGEQKCGTRWILDRLREHPELGMPEREIDFFCRRELLARGPEFYASFFTPFADCRLLGEKSPDYFWLDSPLPGRVADPPAEIRRLLPGVRLVLSLRDPLERAVSAFHHHLVHRGRRLNPLAVARRGIDYYLDQDEPFCRRYGVLTRSYYHRRLTALLDLFGDDLLVLIFERDIVEKPELGLEKICRHLGLAFQPDCFRLRHNVKERKQSLAATLAFYPLQRGRRLFNRLFPGPPWLLRPGPGTVRRLRESFQPEVRNLEGTLQSLGVLAAGEKLPWPGPEES